MAKAVNKKLIEKRNHWKNHIGQWARSGFTQAEYCRKTNLKIKSFGYWKKQFKKKNLPELVQIPADPVYTPCVLKLNIGSGFQIEIPDGFSSATLGQVLLTLKSL